MLCVLSDFNELAFVFCKQKYFFDSLPFQIGVSSSSEDLSLLKRQSLAGTFELFPRSFRGKGR